jgi:phage baseplate assembly protein W
MASASHADRSFLGRGWAFPPASAGTDDVAMAAQEDDVRQAIRIILETERGERVMRPDFGAGLRSLCFEPVTTATLALVRHRVEEALVTWEPRIDLELVDAQPDAARPEVLLITIKYVVRATNSFYNLVYPFYLQEAT